MSNVKSLLPVCEKYKQYPVCQINPARSGVESETPSLVMVVGWHAITEICSLRMVYPFNLHAFVPLFN